MDMATNLRAMHKQTGKGRCFAASAAIPARGSKEPTGGTALANTQADTESLSQNETDAMRVSESKKATLPPVSQTPPEDALAPQAQASRALVPISPAVGPHERFTDHREAAFLAHLIAVKDQLPQTRERRRAEPGEALAAYRAAAGLMR
jgi:hypothetical protein